MQLSHGTKSEKDLHIIFMRIIECMEVDNLCIFPVTFVEFEMAKGSIESLAKHGYFSDWKEPIIDSSYWMAASPGDDVQEFFHKDLESYNKLTEVLNNIFENNY